jgi:NTE family protein
MHVSLVLGAGGLVGQAFHVGVLRALAEARGWDARDADLIVGTSAGAHVGALLRAGLGAHDLFARATGRPLSLAGAMIARELPAPSRMAPPAPPRASTAPFQARRRWPASARYLGRALRRPFALRPGRLVAALLPEGRQDCAPVGDAYARLSGSGWPARPLWITAVHLDSGARVVFGRPGAPALVDVGTAVRCSSAIPGVRRPVRVARQRYVDGGIASGTHVDLVAESPGVALVLSPLSSFAPLRWLLRAELARLRRARVEVETFEPDRRLRALMGWNPMDARRMRAVADAAYAQTLARLGVHG